jgi:hypothetical protein
LSDKVHAVSNTGGVSFIIVSMAIPGVSEELQGVFLIGIVEIFSAFVF